MAEKITVSWDDVSSPEVDEKLRQIADAQPAPEPVVEAVEQRRSLWYHALVYMSFFGLLGGLLGWVLGHLMYLRPDPREQYTTLVQQHQEIIAAWNAGDLKEHQAAAAIKQLRREGYDNPYYRLYINDQLSPQTRVERQKVLEASDAQKDFLANILFYGACGLGIAMCLAAAEPIVERNYPRAVINGSVGAVLGLVGGLVVAMFIDSLYARFTQSGNETTLDLRQQMIARAITWGMLGLFLSLAPGLVLRNLKKLGIGLVGGLLGGVVGGVLYDPIARATDNQYVSRLVAILAIGLVSGLFTGLIENAAKQGWLRVVAGLIAGKQFILYRNPTLIGNSLQCHVYLFKDPAVGRRHAAIHVVPGGYEIEDYPLGSNTFVNGRAVDRARLKHGDRIQIGKSVLLFQEKTA